MLQYAERAKLIPVNATANEGGELNGGADGGREARTLRSQVRALQAELAQLAQRGGGSGGGGDDAVSRQLRQRLDDTQYELMQTFDEKERFARELASSRRANALDRAAARRARRHEREVARQRLQAEQVHGHWVRALQLSEALWASAFAELPRAAAKTQLGLSETELRFCQQRSFSAMLVSGLGDQAAEIAALEEERREAPADRRSQRDSGGRASVPLTAEHAELHSLRQVALKLDALHAESGRGATLRAETEAAYAQAFGLLDEAHAQLQAASAASVARGWAGLAPQLASASTRELEVAAVAEEDDEAAAEAEAYAEALLDVACARTQLIAWSEQLLSGTSHGSQLVSALSELAVVVAAALLAHGARLLGGGGSGEGAAAAEALAAAAQVCACVSVRAFFDFFADWYLLVCHCYPTVWPGCLPSTALHLPGCLPSTACGAGGREAARRARGHRQARELRGRGAARAARPPLRARARGGAAHDPCARDGHRTAATRRQRYRRQRCARGAGRGCSSRRGHVRSGAARGAAAAASGRGPPLARRAPPPPSRARRRGRWLCSRRGCPRRRSGWRPRRRPSSTPPPPRASLQSDSQTQTRSVPRWPRRLTHRRSSPTTRGGRPRRCAPSCSKQTTRPTSSCTGSARQRTI
ncbi:hypothetical protein T492DRAFT_352112 [Pavlovales sp. CCMP2436]|nr:hypothetical protein T492DRAFT_352112 [Pavlovales sp. CCMP2436]